MFRKSYDCKWNNETIIQEKVYVLTNFDIPFH